MLKGYDTTVTMKGAMYEGVHIHKICMPATCNFMKYFVEEPTSRNTAECMNLVFGKLSLPSCLPHLLFYNIEIQTINDIKAFCSVEFHDENQES